MIIMGTVIVYIMIIMGMVIVYITILISLYHNNYVDYYSLLVSHDNYGDGYSLCHDNYVDS